MFDDRIITICWLIFFVNFFRFFFFVLVLALISSTSPMGQSFSWLSHSGVPKLFTVPSEVRLAVRTVDSVKRIESLSFAEFLKSRCPSLFAPFTPPWWLGNGHLQTCYCVVGDFSQVDKVCFSSRAASHRAEISSLPGRLYTIGKSTVSSHLSVFTDVGLH